MGLFNLDPKSELLQQASGVTPRQGPQLNPLAGVEAILANQAGGGSGSSSGNQQSGGMTGGLTNGGMSGPMTNGGSTASSSNPTTTSPAPSNANAVLPDGTNVSVPLGTGPGGSTSATAPSQATIDETVALSNAPLGTKSATPKALSDIPNPSWEDFKDQENGAQLYLSNKLSRLTEIGRLAGLTPDEVSALQEQVSYKVAEATKSMPFEDAVKAGEAVFAEAEAPLVDTYIGTVANGGTPVSEEADSALYTPAEIAAIQAVIGEYMTPYADAAQQSGQNAANVLTQIGSGGGAYGGLVNGMAAQAQAQGNNMAAAYMRQAMALPAVQALEGQQQLANQVTSLRNQLMQYQMAAQSGGSSGGMTAEEMAAAIGGTGQ